MTQGVQKPTSWRSLFEVATTILMVALAAAMVWQNSRNSAVAPQPRRPAANDLTGRAINIAGSATKGRPDAAIVVIEYTDFECSFCARAATGPLKQLFAEYVDSGRVLFVVKNLPLQRHKLAPLAASLAFCAGEQGKFWDAHDALFARKAQLTNENLDALGVEVGLAAKPFAECVGSTRPNNAISADSAEARELGITATPTFVVGRSAASGLITATDVLRGSQSIEDWRELLNRRLAEQPRR
jgi:protein-disulfide isomerase